MSVNLNILANKALRPSAVVRDIESNIEVYTTGSMYALTHTPNVAIPFQGIPLTSSYCSQSVFEWSPDSTFSTAVTSSNQLCNSSSLFGTLLYSGSQTSYPDQPGGTIPNNFAYLNKIFNYALTTSDIQTGRGKTYYIRNQRYGNSFLEITGSWSPVNSVQLMKNNTTDVLTRNTAFWEAGGYNDVTKVWINNIAPTFVSGASAAGSPTLYDATMSYTEGASPMQVVKYGNQNSEALKTNGATFTLPNTQVVTNTDTFSNFSICIVQGSVTASSANGTFSLQMSATTNSGSMCIGKGGVGQQLCGTFNGVRNNPIQIGFNFDTSIGGYWLGVGNLYNTNGTFSPGGPQADSRQGTETGLITLTTSADCVLRYVGTQQYIPTGKDAYNAGFYYSLYGSYTGSLNGPLRPALTTNFPIASNSTLQTFSQWGFPSNNYKVDTGQYEIISGGWYDNSAYYCKFNGITGSVTQSVDGVYSSNGGGVLYQSSSVAGVNGGDYTYQIYGKFGDSSALLRDSRNLDTADVLLTHISSSEVIQVYSPEGGNIGYYTAQYNTGSKELYTLMQSGSVFRVFQNGNELNGIVNPTFNPFNNLSGSGASARTLLVNSSMSSSLIYSRSLNTDDMLNNINYFGGTNLTKYTGNINSTTSLNIPSNPSLQLWGGFGNKIVNQRLWLSGSSMNWYDNNSVSSKVTNISGSIYDFANNQIGFNSGQYTDITIPSASIAGLNGGDYSIQIVGTFPSQSSQELFDNGGGETITLKGNVTPFWQTLDLTNNSGLNGRFNMAIDMSATASLPQLQVWTIMQSGSLTKVYQGLTEVTNSLGTGSNPLPLFDNLASSALKFGRTYKGGIEGLLIYSRSLSLAEISQSINGFGATQIPFIPHNDAEVVSGSAVAIPSASVIQLLSSFGYPSGDYSGSNVINSTGWMDNNPSASKWEWVSGSLTPTAQGLQFDGLTSSINLNSASFAGIARKPYYTIQWALTTPVVGNSTVLIGNPSINQTSPNIGNEVDMIVGNEWTTIKVQRTPDAGTNTYSYRFPTDTSSLHLITLQVSGSTSQFTGYPTVYHNLDLLPISESGGGARQFGGLWDVVDDPNRAYRYYVGALWTNTPPNSTSNHYTGSMKGLLIYSRSLSDSEMTASYNYFIGS